MLRRCVAHKPKPFDEVCLDLELSYGSTVHPYKAHSSHGVLQLWLPGAHHVATARSHSGGDWLQRCQALVPPSEWCQDLFHH